MGGWDEILPSKMLLNEFKKEGKIATTGRYDSRMYQTVFCNDPYFNDLKNGEFMALPTMKYLGLDLTGQVSESIYHEQQPI
ncbi:hypothetical protein KUH03_24840 [Sphingobacterium sp. E70]|uniref:hypothetical protein n=1 Tax=Sphingobacterium sp. E70 TaxID=2853439 RepID=UPI00211BCF36|nr:hypothetical protein [Sphingobacterium sp. E70]ULT22583.1 hypothetical protein KUH03_24840 [Sphingobacterium sp. E70]